MPFTSSIDMIFATLTVLSLVGLAMFVFLLAKIQKPAWRGVLVPVENADYLAETPAAAPAANAVQAA